MKALTSIDRMTVEEFEHREDELLRLIQKKTALRKTVDAEHCFAQRRYDDRYRWTPTKEIGAAIMKALIG